MQTVGMSKCSISLTLMRSLQVQRKQPAWPMVISERSSIFFMEERIAISYEKF